jgi:preprotein translocase subunit SecE
MTVAKNTEPKENAVVRLYRETRSELRKVVWPTREEAIRLTLLVLAVAVAVGALLGFADILFSALYTLLVSSFS